MAGQRDDVSRVEEQDAGDAPRELARSPFGRRREDGQDGAHGRRPIIPQRIVLAAVLPQSDQLPRSLSSWNVWQ
jgi:hypothetical protein